MKQRNFVAARNSKGTHYAATLACLCGVPIEKCLEWLHSTNHKATK